jgi:transcriptional regulator with PAS, ATPase and Fis domain
MLVIVCDGQGRIVQLNKRSEFYGFQQQDLLLKHLSDAISKRTWMQILADLACEQELVQEQLQIQKETGVTKKTIPKAPDNLIEWLVNQFVAEDTYNGEEIAPTYSVALRLGRYSFHMAAVIAFGEFVVLHGVLFMHNKQNIAIGLSQEVLEQRFVCDMNMLDEQENAVITTDTKGTIIYASDSVSNIYGWTATEVCSTCFNFYFIIG